MRISILMLMTTGVLACGGSEQNDTSDPLVQQDSMAASPMAGSSGMQGMQMGGRNMDPDAPIRISRRQAALAGVTFAIAREAPVERTVRAVAMVVPSERGLSIVNARVTGWVERLYLNETGRHVEVGDPLFELYAPDLVTAQEELLLARRLAGTPGGDSVVSATRRRLALWGIPDDVIAEVEQTGVVRRTLTIRSPFTGHVLEKNVIEGQMIRAGDRLFELADLSTVWIEPAIFEADIPLVRVGQRATLTFDAVPGRVFEGRVTFVHPTLDMQTRTLRVRIEIPNRRLEIKPMMYGTVRIRTVGVSGVVVPLTAVLPTGARDLAFVFREGGVVPTDVVVGTRGDSTLLVTQGLTVGDTVVSSATFLFDSESSLAAAMAGIMLNMGMGLDMGGMDMGDTAGAPMPGMDAGQGMKDSSMSAVPVDGRNRR